MASSFETHLRGQLNHWSQMFEFSLTEVEETLRTLTTLDDTHHEKPVPFEYAVSIVPNILDDARHKKQSPIEIALTFRRYRRE